MPALTINGRFLTQPATGVQRFARELLLALDRLLADHPRRPERCTVVHPPGVDALPRLRTFALEETGTRRGHAWEQIDLPRAARGSLLLNLGNTAPLLAGRQLIVIHDAAVYAVPDAYTSAFRTWYRFLYATAGRRASRIVTVSEFSRQELVARAGLRPERIEVVTEGCDHIDGVAPDEGVLDRHRLRGRRYVLAVSSLSPHKNFITVAEAMRLAGLPDTELVVAGGTDPRVFARGGVPTSPVYLGRVSDGELRALYRHAACFVFPSLYEGFGLPPLEAMACGCPVIASNAASLPEVCGDAPAYFDPRSPRALADRLVEVLGDEAVAARLREAGYARARRFTWARCAEQVWTVLEDVLGETGRAARGAGVPRESSR